MGKKAAAFGLIFCLIFFFPCGCKNRSDIDLSAADSLIGTRDENIDLFGTETKSGAENSDFRSGITAKRILEGETGTIHYSYYLPEGYDGEKEYPLVMAIPGYDMMWFGNSSSGSNLNWRGFLCWTELPEAMIVVSAQFTDWGETSARQAIELTEYFIDNFSVDENRVYASGYSAGGETMSRAVSLRPDLYAAYLHGASQWDGDFSSVAENNVVVYIFMAEDDEYYGSQKAMDAYDGLFEAYLNTGKSEEEIEALLRIWLPDDLWFGEHGVFGNYHGGANIAYEESSLLEWIVSHEK